MIILRKIKTSGGDSCRVILSDPLVGVTDGSNQVFTVSEEYTPGRIEIIYNGQVLTSPVDFEETGPNEITFVYLKPEDITVLRANYELGDCSGSSPGGSSDFLGLEDTPTSYVSHGDKLVKVKSDESGLEFTTLSGGTSDFVGLTDTPTTYSGFENYYVKVNSNGTGLEFVLPDNGDTQEGILNIPNGVASTAVSFSRDFDNTNYIVTLTLENTGDVEPSIFPILITEKTVSGFSVEFSGDIDTDNYYLNWRATLSGSGFSSSGGGGLTELSNDSSPQLGGDLEVGSHLTLLDPSPSNTTVSGGFVRGYSGEASEMFVFDNSPMACDGFGTPLYMRSDGKWGTCTAVSGTTQMPCGALALEPGDGSVKKILWKGIIRKGEWSWTPGDVIYVSTVEGALTNVRPNNGHWKQSIGLAIASDAIKFDPGFNPGGV
jgi:hypothetical protein